MGLSRDGMSSLYPLLPPLRRRRQRRRQRRRRRRHSLLYIVRLFLCRPVIAENFVVGIAAVCSLITGIQ